jgi:sphingomyelin phosphodiesterase acid-like 3
MVPSIRRLTRLPRFTPAACLAFASFACICSALPAQIQHSAAKTTVSRPARPDSHTFPALFVSDIHFDPFHDPGKAKQLESAPVSEWSAILASVPSSDQRRAFDVLQKKCGAKGIDTPFTLFQSSVAAMKARQPDAKFMMISGDLLVHDFACRYQELFPQATPGDFQSFALKTIGFVAAQLRSAFPGTPIFTVLGNNDSGCVDYRFDPGSDFFAKAGAILSAGMPVAAQEAMASQFVAEGNYSIPMPPPMKNTRLVALNDTLLSPKYKTCSGKKDSRGGEEEIAWLREQLADARRQGQRVWVVGHIPPGIDPYATAERFKDVCGGEEPVMFLSSSEMPDLLVEYADVVKLGIFAHTHMDEVRLLTPHVDNETATTPPSVAIKMIPSISPVHENAPSFTVATINPETAAMQDYTVIAASNETGEAANWTPEYSFDRTYHQTEVSPAALKSMIDKFRTDNLAVLPESESYLRSYYVGDRSAQLSPFWPQYVCALSNYTGKAYAACVCRTGQ